jgi:hypothetical protein
MEDITGACRDKPKGKDGASMGVHSSRGCQHALFCRDSDFVEDAKISTFTSSPCHRSEISAKAGDTSDEGGRIHIRMTSPIVQTDQSGLRIASKLGRQRTERKIVDLLRKIGSPDLKGNTHVTRS